MPLVMFSLDKYRSLRGSYLDNSNCSWPHLSVAHIAPIGVCVAWESEGHLKKPLICELPLAAFSSSTIRWSCYSCSLNYNSFWQKVSRLQFHLSSCGFLVVVKHIAKICIMHPLGCCSSLLLHNLHNRINLHLSSGSFVFHYNWLMEILGKAAIAHSPFTFCLLSLVLLLLLSMKPQDLHHYDASL